MSEASQTCRDIFDSMTKKQRWAVDILIQVKLKTGNKVSIKDLEKAKNILSNNLTDDQIMAVQYYLDELEKEMKNNTQKYYEEVSKNGRKKFE